MNCLMQNEYRYNPNFRQYVDEYCVSNQCTLEDAFNDEYVKRKFWMYTEV